MKNILFFDTETSGLPAKWGESATNVSNWPRIMSFAYQVYGHDGKFIGEGRHLVKPPAGGFNAHPSAIATNGLSDEKCEAEGIPLDEMFLIFTDLLQNQSLVVAHNFMFDSKILRAEYIRAGLTDPKPFMEKYLCTMMASVKHCAILPDGKSSFKWPKLQELHQKLFGCSFDGAHDALADIRATAKCFWKLKEIGVIQL